MSDKTPNPGTKEAIEAGCKCPRMDNDWGKGAYNDENGNPLFWYNSDCQLHGHLLTETVKPYSPLLKLIELAKRVYKRVIAARYTKR
jgi:hypothetical protein